jgi:ribose transport system ATP-binding protein
VMASSDMLEIVGLSHRAFVMRGGALVGELDRDALDHPAVQESVFRMATALGGRTPEPSSTAVRSSEPPEAES